MELYSINIMSLINFTDKELDYLEYILNHHNGYFSNSIKEKIYQQKRPKYLPSENYSSPYMNDFPPLHTAIKNKQYDKILRLIKCTDVNVTTSNGFSPLHVAARFNYFEIIDLLIENGADVNFKNAYGWTPLMVACEHDNVKIVRKLLQLCKANNLDVNHQSSVGKWTALMRATMSKNKTFNYKSNQKNIIELLVNMGADILCTNSYYQSDMTLGLESENYQIRMLYMEYQKFFRERKLKENNDFNDIFYEKLLNEN